MDSCDWCHMREELYHNERTGMSLCWPCDSRVDNLVEEVTNRLQDSIKKKLVIELKAVLDNA